jgi:hypothetical protein
MAQRDRTEAPVLTAGVLQALMRVLAVVWVSNVYRMLFSLSPSPNPVKNSVQDVGRESRTKARSDQSCRDQPIQVSVVTRKTMNYRLTGKIYV